MKYCRQCGVQLPDEARFCNGCGAAITVINNEKDIKANQTGKLPTETMTAGQKEAINVAPAAPKHQATSSLQANTATGKSKKSIPIFILVVILLGAGVWGWQRSLSEQTSHKNNISTSENQKSSIAQKEESQNVQGKAIVYGNTCGNIVNGGEVAQQGDWLYFSSGGLFRVKIDGSGLTKFCQYGGSYINVVGDWVYYQQQNGGGLNRIKTDGSGLQHLGNESDGAHYMTVAGDWVYFSNYNHLYNLYRIKTDGSRRQKLNDDDSRYVNVAGDWVYYSNESDSYKIYRINTDGSHRQKLNDDKAQYINVAGDWIYYSNMSDSYKIYRVKTDGSGRQKLNDDKSKSINVVGDWLYYSNDSQSGSLYRMNTDGGNKTKLNDVDSNSINIAGDWVYYHKLTDGNRRYRIKTDGSGLELFNSDSVNKGF